MKTTDWNMLTSPFAANDIEWRPLTISKKTGKGLAAAYLSARAVQQRLDDVFGIGGWKNEYREAPGGGIMCRIYFRDDSGEWVWREDGADRTDVEPTKGGLSSAFKRAGAALGIGRYLYELPQQWVPVDDYGKFSQPPRIPREYLPSASPSLRAERPGERPSERPAEAAPERPRERTAERPTERTAERPAERPAERAPEAARAHTSERPAERPPQHATSGDGFDGRAPYDGPAPERRDDRRDTPRGFRPVTR